MIKVFKIEKDGKFFYTETEYPNDALMAVVLDNGYTATEKTKEDMSADYTQLHNSLVNPEEYESFQTDWYAFINAFQQLYVQSTFPKGDAGQ